MTRDTVLETLTKIIAVLLLPLAYLSAPGRARYFACQWALALRFPVESLDGLDRATSLSFKAARAEAFWRHGQLIGLTSGHRDAATQHALFAAEVTRTGSRTAARQRVLPPEESCHVKGTALDVRPAEGALWLETHGDRYGLYRRYDNEWWHFEHHPTRPTRYPTPAANSPTKPFSLHL
jgi:zinc D-Ala-D-Ala carboxypeptidase